MDDFLKIIASSQIDLPEVIFLMVFSLGIALFHTIIFSSLYNWDFSPKWLFFLLNPALIGLTYLWFGNYVFFTFILLFVSVFLLGIIGMLLGNSKNDVAEEHFNKKHNIQKKPLWQRILLGIGTTIFALFFFSIGPYAFVLMIFIGILAVMLPNSRNRFLKYQSILPSSKIRSVAMGLAEIQGRLVMNQELLSPIKKKPCIGYEHRIERISTDKDGKKSYSTIVSEIVCNRFYVEDETGRIEINPDNIDFHWIELDEQYSSAGKRYSQYLLKNNDEMLIIGKAGLEGNTPVFMFEEIKNVFGIAPSEKVGRYNKNKPLLNSFYAFSVVFAFFAALVLVMPITIENGIVTLKINADLLDWNHFFTHFNHLF